VIEDIRGNLAKVTVPVLNLVDDVPETDLKPFIPKYVLLAAFGIYWVEQNSILKQVPHPENPYQRLAKWIDAGKNLSELPKATSVHTKDTYRNTGYIVGYKDKAGPFYCGWAKPTGDVRRDN
jgi:hypothetical protein